MKSAWIILSCVSIVWTIKIENFDSTGVYFQHQGNVRLSNGRLEYYQAVDLDIIDRYAKYLRTEFDVFLAQHQDSGNVESKVVAQIIDDILKMNEMNFPEIIYYPNGKGLTTISHEVKGLVSLLKSTEKELKEGFLPSQSKIAFLKNKFEFIKNFVENDDFDPNLLSFPIFKDDLKSMNITDDPKILFENAQQMATVTKKRSRDNKIYILIVVNLVDPEILNLWKVISVPIIRQQNVVTLQNNYKFLATSPSRIYASEAEVSNLPYHKSVKIANKDLFVSLDDKSCLFGILNGNKSSVSSCEYVTSFDNIEIFQHLGNYRYLFAIRDSTKYTYTCPEMDHNIESDESIQGTGILTLNEGCTFRTEDSELKAVKIHAVVEPNDKYVFEEIMKGILETLHREVLKEPPLLPPLTKVTSDFDEFYKSSNRIEQYQQEIQETKARLDNRPVPTRSSFGLNFHKKDSSYSD